MKEFRSYIGDPNIKKSTPNHNEIISIKEDAISRFETFLKQQDIKEMTKYVFENLYESLRELSEAISLLDGLKIYSHEITISYLSSKGYLEETQAKILDDFRKLRNKSKYYGKDISSQKLKESLPDMIMLKDKLINTITTRG